MALTWCYTGVDAENEFDECEHRPPEEELEERSSSSVAKMLQGRMSRTLPVNFGLG